MNKTYAEVEGKEIFKLEVARGKLAVLSRQLAVPSWRGLFSLRLPTAHFRLAPCDFVPCSLLLATRIIRLAKCCYMLDILLFRAFC